MCLMEGFILRTNGSALEQQTITEEYGCCCQYENRVVYLHTAGRITIFNRKPEQTEATYDKILTVLAGKRQ